MFAVCSHCQVCFFCCKLFLSADVRLIIKNASLGCVLIACVCKMTENWYFVARVECGETISGNFLSFVCQNCSLIIF